MEGGGRRSFISGAEALSNERSFRKFTDQSKDSFRNLGNTLREAAPTELSMMQGLQFLRGTLDPKGATCGGCITPPNLNHAQTIVQSLEVYGNFAAVSGVSGAIVWLPQNGVYSIHRYNFFATATVIPAQPSGGAPPSRILGLAGLSCVLTQNIFLPSVASEDLAISPNLDTNFVSGRVIAGVIQVRSDATSTGTVAMSGVLSAGALNDTRNAPDFAPPKLAQQSTVKKDGLVDVKVQDAVVALVGCDISPDVTRPLRPSATYGDWRSSYINNVLPQSLSGLGLSNVQPYSSSANQPGSCWISPFSILSSDGSQPTLNAPLNVTGPQFQMGLEDSPEMMIYAQVGASINGQDYSKVPVGYKIQSSIVCMHYFVSSQISGSGSAETVFRIISERFEVSDTTSPQYWASINAQAPNDVTTLSGNAAPLQNPYLHDDGVVSFTVSNYVGTTPVAPALPTSTTTYPYWRIPQKFHTAPRRFENTQWFGSFITTTNSDWASFNTNSIVAGSCYGVGAVLQPGFSSVPGLGLLPGSVAQLALASAQPYASFQPQSGVYEAAPTTDWVGTSANVAAAMVTGGMATGQPLMNAYSIITGIDLIASRIYEQGSLGPARVIRYDNVASGQNILVNGSIIVEAIPTGAIAPYYGSQSQNASAMNTNLVGLLAFLDNGESPMFKRIYKGIEYQQILDMMSDFSMQKLLQAAPMLQTPKGQSVIEAAGMFCSEGTFDAHKRIRFTDDNADDSIMRTEKRQRSGDAEDVYNKMARVVSSDYLGRPQVNDPRNGPFSRSVIGSQTRQFKASGDFSSLSNNNEFLASGEYGNWGSLFAASGDFEEEPVCSSYTSAGLFSQWQLKPDVPYVLNGLSLPIPCVLSIQAPVNSARQKQFQQLGLGAGGFRLQMNGGKLPHGFFFTVQQAFRHLIKEDKFLSRELLKRYPQKYKKGTQISRHHVVDTKKTVSGGEILTLKLNKNMHDIQVKIDELNELQNGTLLYPLNSMGVAQRIRKDGQSGQINVSDDLVDKINLIMSEIGTEIQRESNDVVPDVKDDVKSVASGYGVNDGVARFIKCGITASYETKQVTSYVMYCPYGIVTFADSTKEIKGRDGLKKFRLIRADYPFIRPQEYQSLITKKKGFPLQYIASTFDELYVSKLQGYDPNDNYKFKVSILRDLGGNYLERYQEALRKWKDFLSYCKYGKGAQAVTQVPQSETASAAQVQQMKPEVTDPVNATVVSDSPTSTAPFTSPITPAQGSQAAPLGVRD